MAAILKYTSYSPDISCAYTKGIRAYMPKILTFYDKAFAEGLSRHNYTG